MLRKAIYRAQTLYSVVDKELVHMDYVADVANNAREPSAKDDESDPAEKKREERPPITVNLR